jgi:peptidoglycan hydrolase CwlO-like protein
MKKIILLIVFLALVFTGFLNRTTLANTANNFLYQSPCQSPKTFRLGTVDPRFHITKDELLQDAQEAGGVWKNEQGMILMQYDPNSQMPINMVYDQRQYLDSQINNLNDQVAQQKDSLKPQIADYQQKAAEFKKESTDLNTQIDYWNTKGGAPQDVYNGLVAKQHSLQQEATQLSQMADQLNQSTDAYNQQIQQLNQKVNNYNNVLSYKPEEGLYTKDGTNEKIDIYFNNSRMELVHTLAHEMGHSLGLGHNSNPESIMYPETNLITTPSVDDENALAQVCAKKSIFVLAGEKLVFLLEALHQSLNNLIVQYQQ